MRPGASGGHGHKNYCLDKDHIPPGIAVINSSFLVCTNAKSGTTSFANLSEAVMDNFHFLSYKEYLDPANFYGTCIPTYRNQNTVLGPNPLCLNHSCGLPSVVLVRNPWDRVASAYRDKVSGCDTCSVEMKTINDIRHGQHPGICDNCATFTKFILSQPYGNHTFGNFVRYWVKNHANENIHTMEYDVRCLTTSNPYSKVIFLENGLMSGFADFFNTYSTEYPPLSRWKQMARRFAIKNKSHCTAGCEPEVDSEFHAKKSAEVLLSRRQLYLNATAAGGLNYPTELVDIVADVYKADIEKFGYSFTRYGPA